MGTVHLGLSLGHRTDRDAEHWLADNLPAGLPDLVVCTHNVPAPHPHVALSFAFEGRVDGLPEVEPDFRAAADEAAARHRDRLSGRAVHFPGISDLVGTLTAAEILELSAIERVTVLASGDAAADAVVETQNFVRPLWRDGRLELVLVPAVGGVFVPFESPNPIPCCADH